MTVALLTVFHDYCDAVFPSDRLRLGTFNTFIYFFERNSDSSGYCPAYVCKRREL